MLQIETLILRPGKCPGALFIVQRTNKEVNKYCLGHIELHDLHWIFQVRQEQHRWH